MLRLRLLAFFLTLIKKAPDNNTPAIKISPSSVLLEVEAMVVARFVAAAFWRMVADRFWMLQLVAQQKSMCVIRVRRRRRALVRSSFSVSVTPLGLHVSLPTTSGQSRALGWGVFV